MIRLISVVGARPQFIKSRALSSAIQIWNENNQACFEEILIHTGQHYDFEMSDVFFRELQLPKPRYELGVGSGTHAYQTGEIMKRLEPILLNEHPDLVLVYGDTNSTLAAALCASKIHFPIAHIEAGERSFNQCMPEEINRVLTDHISSLLFCSSKRARENLEREGITRGVFVTGDVMRDVFESLKSAVDQVKLPNDFIDIKEYVVVTIHRAENTDDPARLNSIFEGLRQVAKSGLRVICPLHPRTRKAIKNHAIDTNDLMIIKPLSYLGMIRLMRNARAIITDSGGVQKEALWLGVPCITVRDETEWVETVESGWNQLVGVSPERIVHAVITAKPGWGSRDIYGTGQAGKAILEHIFHWIVKRI